ncbi:hypothetical protein F3J37_01240 [Pantoea sp. Al-1710]|uniref:Uncharacterized protein n=1 Tax=Candidatus Pantoea communis TaxID=2608354 RepID=A0ABX0RI56_9GAMM|nr:MULTISPECIES: hypothetical protein [Pantoea]NIG12998.1 hypothetical protein [Pantoea sp. Cy-640]NIG17301.1 hypothetical protein [Pantoea communis]
MSDLRDLTSDAIQITDGSTGAHVTAVYGAVLYADSADSTVWHTMFGLVLEIRPPVVIYMKAKSPGGAQVIVTSWSES